MPASRLNYVVMYDSDSQVYGSSTKKVALESPPPSGIDLSEKKVFFITHDPDKGQLSVHQLDDKEVQEAELKYKTTKKDKDGPT